MTVARRHNSFGVTRGAGTGWCALAVRMLALLLALAITAPEAGLAADLHHHLGSQSGTLAMAPDPAVTAQSADPGIATHLHCGCHVAAPVSAADPVLPLARPRPRYGRVAAALPSLVPAPLPRPPRA